MNEKKIIEEYKRYLIDDIPDSIPESTMNNVMSAIASKKKRSQTRKFPVLYLRVASFILLAGVIFSILLMSKLTDLTVISPAPFQLKNIKPFQMLNTQYPLISHGTMLFLQEQDHKTCLVALNRESGEIIWKSDELTNVASLAVSKDMAFVRYSDKNRNELIKALDIKTGKKLWSFESKRVPSINVLSNLISLDKLLCWTEGNSLFILNSQTGKLKLKKEFQNSQRLSIPIVVDTTLYIASDKGIFVIDTLADSNPKKLVAFSEKVSKFKRPYIIGNQENIVVALTISNKTRVLCYDIKTGAKKWKRVVHGPLYHLYLKDNVYIKSNQLYALSWKTGKVNWSKAIGGCSQLSFEGNSVYTTDGKQKGNLLSLDISTGDTLWQLKLAASCSGLVISGGNGYVSSNNGMLYGIKL